MDNETTKKSRSLTPVTITSKSKVAQLNKTLLSRPRLCREDTPKGVSKFLLREYSESRPARHSVLSQVRQRKNRRKSTGIDVSVVSSVIGEYLLPLFQAESVVTQSHKLKAMTSKPLQGPVVSEFKLSQQLLKDNQKLSQEVTSLRQRVRDLEQGKSEHEHEKLRSELCDVQQALHSLNLSYSLATRQWHVQENQLYLQEAYGRRYKDKYESLLLERDELTSQLVAEKALNDRYKNQTAELAHSLALVELENSIMGERLKGLCEAFASLPLALAQDWGIAQERNILLDTFLKDLWRLESLQAQAQNLVQQRDTYLESAANLADVKAEAEGARDQSHKFYRDKLAEFVGLYDELVESNEYLIKQTKEQSSQLEALKKEHQNAKSKLKQWVDSEDRICLSCHQVYTENTNFNWVCRRHRSEYSGVTYFCCGASEKYAPGCEISKHASSEDHITLEVDARKVVFCFSCKESGHSVGNCPRDPNVRTNYCAGDELARLDQIKSLKNKGELHQRSLQERMLELVAAKKLVFN